MEDTNPWIRGEKGPQSVYGTHRTQDVTPVVQAEKPPFLHEEIYAIIALVDDVIDVHVETN
jgi:hypothetical protein